jgi:hypothetical protein
MTKLELQGIQGFHAPTLIAAAAHLRATMPRKAVASEPTAIIRNEGHMNGFLDAIDALISAASQQPAKADRVIPQPYSQPAQPQNENQNKP